MNKPNKLVVDGDTFEIYDDLPLEYGINWYVHGAGRLNLSPYEVRELRDWLSCVLEWSERNKTQ